LALSRIQLACDCVGLACTAFEHPASLCNTKSESEVMVARFVIVATEVVRDWIKRMEKDSLFLGPGAGWAALK
jgi:hypothetical protein